MIFGEFLELINKFGLMRYVWLRNGMDTIAVFPSDSKLLDMYCDRLISAIDIRDFCNSCCYDVSLTEKEEHDNE